MKRKKKDLDIFEGTFLEGLMDLDEKEVNEALPEVSEKDHVVGDLLQIEIKLYVLLNKKFKDFAVIENGLINARPKTFEKSVEYLKKIVAKLQQGDVLRKLLFLSIANRIGGSMISLFDSCFSETYTKGGIEIKKGFKVVFLKTEFKFLEEIKMQIQSFKFLNREWERMIFNDETIKDKENKIKYFRFLITEWEKILYGNL